MEECFEIISGGVKDSTELCRRNMVLELDKEFLWQ